jgi:hypothetical protein
VHLLDISEFTQDGWCAITYNGFSYGSISSRNQPKKMVGQQNKQLHSVEDGYLVILSSTYQTPQSTPAAIGIFHKYRWWIPRLSLFHLPKLPVSSPRIRNLSVFSCFFAGNARGTIYLDGEAARCRGSFWGRNRLDRHSCKGRAYDSCYHGE